MNPGTQSLVVAFSLLAIILIRPFTVTVTASPLNQAIEPGQPESAAKPAPIGTPQPQSSPATQGSGPSAALREVSGKVKAEAALLVDADNGEVLFSRRAKEKFPPASTVKLMTALLAYELRGGMDGSIKVVGADAAEPSHVPLRTGEVVSAKALFHSILIGSDNDSARALARHGGGSVEEFMSLMNRYAKRLGCTGSHFKNPNGLPAPGQVTTCEDLLRIFQTAMTRPEIREICRRPGFTLKTQAKTQFVKNHNRLLFKYEGMGPAKTGWTRASLHTYAAEVQRGNRRFHLVLLKSPNKWNDATALFDYAFQVRPPKPGSWREGSVPLPSSSAGSGLVLGPVAGAAASSTASTETPASGRATASATGRTVTDRNGTVYLSESGRGNGEVSSRNHTSYTIRKGDTLFKVARRHGCTVDMLVQANGMSDPNKIIVGQTIRVPQP